MDGCFFGEGSLSCSLFPKGGDFAAETARLDAWASRGVGKGRTPYMEYTFALRRSEGATCLASSLASVCQLERDRAFYLLAGILVGDAHRHSERAFSLLVLEVE